MNMDMNAQSQFAAMRGLQAGRTQHNAARVVTLLESLNQAIAELREDGWAVEISLLEDQWNPSHIRAEISKSVGG